MHQFVTTALLIPDSTQCNILNIWIILVFLSLLRGLVLRMSVGGFPERFHNLPVEHLDYSYIQQCSDIKYLVKILHVLRSTRLSSLYFIVLPLSCLFIFYLLPLLHVWNVHVKICSKCKVAPFSWHYKPSL